MATATETIELQERETVNVFQDDRSDTAIVGSQQTWKVPSINKYRIPVTFWSLAVCIITHVRQWFDTFHGVSNLIRTLCYDNNYQIVPYR